jgi:PilZ domain-containing protein
MSEGKESRAYSRYPLTGSITVSWQDEHAQFHALQARGIDICETGIQIELTEAIDKGSTVTVRAERHRLAVSTSVRYCRRQGPKYRIGLEFIGGYRWRPPEATTTASGGAH